MSSPNQCTAMERMARALTDDALADRLERLSSNVRRFTAGERIVYLTEAARRLRWGRKTEKGE